MTHTRIEGKFYPLQNDEWLRVWSELKPTEVQVLYYLRSIDPFGDKEIELGVTQLSNLLNLAKSTVSKALKKLNQLGWIDLELIKVRVKLRSKSSSAQSPLLTTENNVSHSKPQFPPGNTSFSQETTVSPKEQPQAQMLSGQGFESPKTLKTIKTTQDQGAVENQDEVDNTDVTTPVQSTPQVSSQNSEVPRTDATTTNSTSRMHISNILPSPPNSRQDKISAASENDSQISLDLTNKLSKLGIPLDSRVKRAIAQHNLSQAWAAIAHIERTWENINNPRGVFLYQISRQPVEPQAARSSVRTAADWGYTLEDLKKMYPNNWQDAAAYFGVEVE